MGRIRWDNRKGSKMRSGKSQSNAGITASIEKASMAMLALRHRKNKLPKSLFSLSLDKASK